MSEQKKSGWVSNVFLACAAVGFVAATGFGIHVGMESWVSEPAAGDGIVTHYLGSIAKGFLVPIFYTGMVTMVGMAAAEISKSLRPSPR